MYAHFPPSYSPSTKHKKERQADFTKAKLKLGKGKQVANNATDTSFSAKSIALPSQSLSATPKGAPVSRRNLTLPELLVQSRHYSVPTRREALHEMHQLVVAHPFLLQQHLLALVTCLSHLVGDESLSVRAAARTLLAHVADTLPRASFVSVSPAIVLFTLSALSSLEDIVRVDALRVLDLLLAVIPDELTRGFDPAASFSLSSSPASLADSSAPSSSSSSSASPQSTPQKILEALLGLLKIRSAALAAASGSFTASAAPAASDLSPLARLAALQTLARFLSAAGAQARSSAGAETHDDVWYLASAFADARAASDFVASLRPRRAGGAPVVHVAASGTATSAAVEPFADLHGGASALGPLSGFGLLTPPPEASPASASGHAPTLQQQHAPPSLLALLHPTLVSSFLDAAPSAFSPSLLESANATAAAGGENTHLATVLAVLQIARELYARELGGGTATGAGSPSSKRARDARKSLVALLSHASAYFPFGADEPVALAGAGKKGARKDGAEGERHETLLQLNVAFAELSSLLVLSAPGSGDDARGNAAAMSGKKGKKRSGDKGDERGVEEVVVERVQEWVVQALRGELTTPSHPLGLALPLSSFHALRPALWSLLQQPSTERANDVFAAVVEYFCRGAGGAGGGEAKREAGEWLGAAVLIHSSPSYTSPFSLDPLTAPLAASQTPLSAKEQRVNPLAKWLAALPKWLWESGGKDDRATELVLSVLLKLSQQGPLGLIPPSTLLALAPLLAPFFHLSHPSRGPIPGPFTRLSPASGLQQTALHLVEYLRKLADEAGSEDERDKVRQLEEAVSRARGSV
ncbi:Ipi1p [Rhodotorula paludigena]|uniref:Ipi1p n=1 Tax=Rhodotorula paludigena TaxID=86838 RepID=UPI00316DB909